MYAVYALIDPRDFTVHYVGQTSDVYTRFKQHINGDGGSLEKKAWIFELRAVNRMIIMETLEEVETEREARICEEYWIKHFQTLKQPLSNAVVTNGGYKRDKQAAMKLAMLRVSGHIEEIKIRAREAMMTDTDVICTPDQESLIIKTVDQMQREGLPVTREAIKQRLGWNNAKHPVVKFVCDKHKIAVR